MDAKPSAEARTPRAMTGQIPQVPRRLRAALRAYSHARARLHDLGVCRTDGSMAGQFSEWVAARHLGLRLVKTGTGIIDAVDRAGRTYEIKGRIISGTRASTSFDFRRPLHRFGFFVGVLVSPTFDVLAIMRVPFRGGPPARSPDPSRLQPAVDTPLVQSPVGLRAVSASGGQAEGPPRTRREEIHAEGARMIAAGYARKHIESNG